MLDRLKELSTVLLADLHKLLAVGFFLPNVSVGLILASQEVALQVLQLKVDFLALLAESLSMVTLGTLLLDLLLLLELLNVLLCLAESLNVLSLLRDLVSIVAALVGFNFAVEALKVDAILDDHLLKSCLLHVLLAILALHVLEKSTRTDLDFNDLAGGQVNAPAADHVTHFSDDLLAQLLPVVNDVLNRRVGDLVAHNGARHAPKSLVGEASVSTGQVKGLVGLQWVVLVDSPLDHGLDLEALHLFGHLLRGDLHFDKIGREGGHLVKGAAEASQADARLDLFAISHDDGPFVRLALHAQAHYVIVQDLAQLVQELEQEKVWDPFQGP